MQRTLIYEIDNESITLGTSPYFFDSITGLSNTDCDISSSTALYQDGMKVNYVTAKERSISISGRIRGKDRQEAFELRRKLIHIFSAKRGLGKLIVRYSDGTEYYVECMANGGVEITEQNVSVIQSNVFEFSIDLICPNPFFKQEEVFETHFTQVLPLWEFEMLIDADDPESFKFGEVYHSQTTILENKGDVPSGFYCNVVGKITDYFVLKHLGKGKEIRIEMDFTNVSELQIYSEQGKKKVYIIYKDGRKEVGYKYMTDESEFFELHAGNNQLYFETNSKDVDLQVKIEHKNLFIGI